MTLATRVAGSLVILLVAAAPASSQTQVGATEDAIAWLQRNLGGAACVVYDVGPSVLRMERVTENTEVTFDGCLMTLHQAAVIGSRSEVRTFKVPLAALDARSVTASDGFVLPEGWTTAGDIPTHTIGLAVPGRQLAIDATIETFDGTAPRAYRTHALDILVRHQENAEQIVLALTRAIAQCRQQ